ncbi:clavesin-2 [Diabrotica virgifera virgifera]|uniref:Clavesin-2-like isoform X1 n=2 Tax=Diabrotica virgifera virgifera TaxID=50390 RepID=A0A6P7F7H7_DIAVI|nr:clavesin-2 [Diabrotica virgifera virgifera]
MNTFFTPTIAQTATVMPINEGKSDEGIKPNSKKKDNMSEFIEYSVRHPTLDLTKITLPKYKDQKERLNETTISLRNMISQCEDDELKAAMKNLNTQEIQKFLYARKFMVEDSYTLLKNYLSYKKRHPEICENLTISAVDIQKSLENGLPGVLRQKDRKGRCILLFTGNNWDCSYSLQTIFRAFLLVLEHLIEHVHNQSNGFVVIVDWTEFTFRQSTYLKPSVLKLMIEGLQDCFPARFKGIHFIAQPWYVETALALIKPFLNEKVKERIFVHGNNLSTLHEHVHKDVLPAELGGEEPSYDHRTFLDMLQERLKQNHDTS